MELSICICGRIYQPPVENSWLEAIGLQGEKLDVSANPLRRKA